MVALPNKAKNNKVMNNFLALGPHVVSLSGGLDSSCLAAKLVNEIGAENVLAISIDYGQRHQKEIQAATDVANLLNIKHTALDVHNLAWVLGGSSQTCLEIPVPHGHYADESMRVTVVPNRNMILLAIAAGYAISQAEGGPSVVAIANHAGDHAVYPDCRPDFIVAMRKALSLCHYEEAKVSLYTPYLKQTKADIVWTTKNMRNDHQNLFALTWSCYEGGHKHCGKCGTCVERREAFELAKVNDPTTYAD